MSSDPLNVTVTAAINNLREQLEQAIKDRPKSGLQFTLGDIDFEFQVYAETSKHYEGEAKIQFKLLPWPWPNTSADAELGIESHHKKGGVHTVRVRLHPYLRDDEGHVIRGEDGRPKSADVSDSTSFYIPQSQPEES